MLPPDDNSACLDPRNIAAGAGIEWHDQKARHRVGFCSDLVSIQVEANVFINKAGVKMLSATPQSSKSLDFVHLTIKSY
jgi:hypothetical protein